MRAAIIILWLLALVDLQATQTLLKRSLFIPASLTNCAEISATNLLSFDSISTGNSWPIIAVGATTNSQPDLGWSGWVQKTGNTNSARFTNLVVNTYYQASCWFRLHQFSTAPGSESVQSDVSSSAARFLTIGRDGDLSSMSFGVAGAGSLWFLNANGATTNLGTLSINQWYYFACAWRSTNDAGTFKKDGQVYLGIGSTATNVYSFTGVTANNKLTWADFGCLNPSGNDWSGRITGASIHTLSDGFPSAGVPTDINPPVEARTSFYINPATGSDLNSGIYATNAFATAYQGFKMLRFGGLKGGLVPWVYTSGGAEATPGANPWAWNRGVMDGSIHATGDKLLLDTSSAVLRSTNTWRTKTNSVGVEIGSANATPAEIRPWTLLSGTWTQYDAVNFPNIWQLANPLGQSNIVVWEDQKWMNNPTNTSGLVNLTTNLNSTPGSFWTDTTNVYVHPFDSTNPNSDGKTYEVSNWMWTVSGVTATLSKYHPVELLDNGTFLNNLKIWGTVFRNQYTGVWDDTYVVRLVNNGPSVIGNTELLYGGKHVYGAVGGSTTLYRFNYNSIFQQGPPWDDVSGVSGSGNEVEFPEIGTGTRQAYFWNCNAATNSVIGSTTGSTSLRDGFFSHESAGPYEAYSAIHYFNCAGAFRCGDAMVTQGNLIVSNSTSLNISLGVLTTNILNPLIVRTYLDGPIYGISGGTVKDSVINRTDDLNQNLLMAGDWSFSGTTFDVRSTTNTVNGLSIIKSDATLPVTLSVSNCLVLLPNSATDIVFLRYKTNDVLTSNNNVYLINGLGRCNYFQNGATSVTWAQWQANGYDAASSTNNPAIGPGYRPYAKTPLWNVATDRGASIDYTGKPFQSRRTAGAYEYDPPWMMLP